MHSKFNLIKHRFWVLFFTKPDNLGSKPHIFDAKTDPFISFGDNSFEYLEHIGIQIIEKLTGKIVSCV